MTFPILGGNGAVAGYTIDNSLRFNSSDTPNLARTPSASNRDLFTISLWAKRSNLNTGARQVLFGVGNPATTNQVGFEMRFDNSVGDGKLRIGDYVAGVTDYVYLVTDAIFRDVSAWYHIVYVYDSAQATNTNRTKLYVNGNQITSFSSPTYPNQNQDSAVNSATQHTIGNQDGNGYEYNGYLSEINFIDGQALSPTDFGEFDEDSGIWKPIQYTGSYGTNGFYLDFENSGSLGTDQSGNGNNFTPTNLASTDQMIDTPTKVFCTINPLDRLNIGGANAEQVTSEGNLKITGSGNEGRSLGSTFAITPNGISKAYAEWYSVAGNTSQDLFNLNNINGYIANDGTDATNIAMMAVDCVAGKYWFGQNGTWDGSGDPANGTNATGTFTANSEVQFGSRCYNSSRSQVVNFGQDSTFAGNKTRQSNTDSNGEGDFYYTPPTGFLSLNSANLSTQASPTIDDGSQYFNTVLYSGNSSVRSITGVGFQPDWTWIKSRSNASWHALQDSSRGSLKTLFSNQTDSETTYTDSVTSFDSDGFSMGDDSEGGSINVSSRTYVAWNWIAGGTSPTQTYTVKVVSDSGNKYRFDDFGTSAVTLDLQEGGTYTFDQSDSSNSGHPLRFSTTSDGTHGSGSEYTTGVTTTGTAGSAGAKTVITVAASAPTLYYYCSSHSGMGGQANTNTTHGSSNFAGSIQSVAQANTTAGFSIVTYTGNQATGATVGHNLGIIPETIWVKPRNGTTAYGWRLYFKPLGNTNYVNLNATDPTSAFTDWNNTSPTSSVFTVNSSSPQTVNESGTNYIAYCFSSIEGYSKIGSYTGNGNADGTYVSLGFRPQFIIVKRTDSTGNWHLVDNKRNGFNVDNDVLLADTSDAEFDVTQYDILSNGFKLRSTASSNNASGGTYIYMAFAENPFVDSNGIPVTAR